MNNLVESRLKRLASPVSRWLARFAQRQMGQDAQSKPPHLPPDVQEALALSATSLFEPAESPQLVHLVGREQPIDALPSPRGLFFIDGNPLPCWLETDLTFVDDWLTSPYYYPVYYSLFCKLTVPEQKSRLFEIGVRTGYLGVVFAKAARGPCFYLGVDPNLYVQNGLQLASDTFKILRSLGNFDFSLIEGYSWESHVQKTLIYSGPFDIIHIDGDHTLPGKLIDLNLSRHLVSQSGIILVDDYDYHPTVSDAIKRAMTLGWFREFLHVSSKRGLAVLRC